MNNDQKDQLIDTVADALENDGMAIIFTDTKGNGVHFIQGNPVKIISLIVRGMEKDRRINFIFNKAVQFKREVLDKRSRPKPDETLSDLFAGALDCENCPEQDDCDVRDKVSKMTGDQEKDIEIVRPEKSMLDELFKCFNPADLDKIINDMKIQKIKKRN